MNESTSKIRYVSFVDIFSDALRFYRAARAKGIPPDLLNALSKSSVLHCVLAIEALANALTEELPYSKKTKESIDRLKHLDKFELFLSSLQPKKLDRGINTVQKLIELIDLRNKYVHPKTNEIPIDFDIKKMQISFDGTKTPHLNIPKDSAVWDYRAAQKAIIATNDFLNHFLADLCQLHPEDIIYIIFPTLYTNKQKAQLFDMNHRSMFQYGAAELGLDFRYIDLKKPVTDQVFSYMDKPNSNP